MFPAKAPKTYSILLAHALTMVREGLAALCQAQPQYRVVDQCSDGATALRLIESGRPDIAVLDLNLPELFTLEVVRKLRLTGSQTRIVVLSTRKDRKTVVEALRSGVDAFLLKSGPAHQFMEAFEQTLDGGIYVSSSLDLNKIFSPRHKSASEDPFATLSPREHQVFSLLVEGTRAKEIGARLGLNPKTIDTYRANLMRKLDIHDVAGLVRFDLMAKYKFRYIDCRACGQRITLQTYTGHIVSSRLSEDIKCPKCHKESAYSGDDFRTSEGLDPSR